MHQVQIDPRVPKNIPDHELRRLLPRIFYELSPDGTQLFTRIIELRSSNSRAIIVKDQVKVFGVYAVVDCIPNYDLLNLRRTTSVEQSLEQWDHLIGPGGSAPTLSVFSGCTTDMASACSTHLPCPE